MRSVSAPRRRKWQTKRQTQSCSQVNTTTQHKAQPTTQHNTTQQAECQNTTAHDAPPHSLTNPKQQTTLDLCACGGLSDAAGVLTGILTDKDVMGRVVALGLVPENTLVSAVMTRSPSCVSPNDVALDALAKMVEGRFRHLPVVKGSQVGSCDHCDHRQNAP